MPASTSAPLTTEPLGGLDDARGLWETLAGPTANPFASWDFADSWWGHLGGDAALELRVALRGGEPVGVLPLLRHDGELRFVGHRDGDLLGPVCAPEDRAECLAALRDYALSSGATLVADELPEGSAGILGGEVVRRTPFPVVDVPSGGFEALLASRSASLRKGIRRQERRLARAHGVRVRTADADTLAQDMGILIDLHNRRWGEESKVYRGARVAMCRDLAERFHIRGWLRLRVLELDGRPVAANYALRVGDAEWYYQAGRDPSLRRESVGFVLQAASIRAACEEGARECRMLRGAQAFKLRWATGDQPVETVRLEPR